MELYVALAKKKVHIFKKIYEKTLKIGRSPSFEVVKDEKVFFIVAEINP